MAGLAWLGAPTSARADATAAEALFHRGRELLEAGQPAEACRVLAESQKLYPSSGTLLNLGECSERQGKTATAWSYFVEAKRFATTTNREAHAAEAENRLERLKTVLSFLTIRVPYSVPNLVVSRNGVELDRSKYGVRVPVDPGHYDVTAKAPGYVTWTAGTDVGTTGDVREVVVPRLDPVASPAPRVAPAPRPAEPNPLPHADRAPPSEGMPTASIVLGGIGAAALVAGGISGVVALRSYSEAEGACPTHTGCSDDAINARDRAGTQALVSDIALAVGVVSLGAATYFYFSNTAEEPSRTAPGSARARRVSVGVTGRF